MRTSPRRMAVIAAATSLGLLATVPVALASADDDRNGSLVDISADNVAKGGVLNGNSLSHLVGIAGNNLPVAVLTNCSASMEAAPNGFRPAPILTNGVSNGGYGDAEDCSLIGSALNGLNLQHVVNALTGNDSDVADLDGIANVTHVLTGQAPLVDVHQLGGLAALTGHDSDGADVDSLGWLGLLHGANTDVVTGILSKVMNSF